MERRYFPTEFVRVAGAVPGLRDGERVTILEVADGADGPRYRVETWDGRRLWAEEHNLTALGDASDDDWDEQADQTVQDDWAQQADQAQD